MNSGYWIASVNLHVYKFGLQIHVSVVFGVFDGWWSVFVHEVAEARENRVPLTTQRHTFWSRHVYEHWAKARNNEFGDFTQESEKFTCVPSIDDVTVEQANYWFSKLALEVRKRDGLDYLYMKFSTVSFVGSIDL